MDYGPTIAAAFAASQDEMIQSPSSQGATDETGMNTSNDVSSLRKIILGCMRNARDAALVVHVDHTNNPSSPTAAASPGREYTGRYDEEFSGTSRNGKDPLHHQAFSAESSARRRAPAHADSINTEESGENLEETATADAATTQIVDLLG